MNEIRKLLKIARRRLEWSSFLTIAHHVALGAVSLALLLALADRAPAESFVGWLWVGPFLLVVLLAVAILLWTRRRLTDLQVALSVDERLDLREKLSTALHVERRQDAFAQAALEDAVNTASDPRTQETLRRRFRIHPPRRWWISPLLLIAAIGVLFLPQADLFARETPRPDTRLAELKQQTDATLQEIVTAIEDKDLLKSELEGEMAELTPEGQEPPDALKKPEEVRRDALKKVTELNKKLDEIISGEKGKTAKSLEEMMAKLKTPTDGPGKELGEALAKGNFQNAKEALEKMLEQAQQGMDPKQAEQLAQQLDDLAKQLEQLAQQQQQLEQALQQAGLNPQLANNPQALQQALEQAQNLNEQQRQQLQQMMQAQQAAQQMCQGLGQACQQMAQALQQGQAGQQGMQQAGQQMAGQLSQLEQMQMLLQQAQAMANACQGQCQKLGGAMTFQQIPKQGGGMGNWGQGAGGTAPKSPTPTGTNIVKENPPVVAGEVIGVTKIEGVPIRGEAQATLKQVSEAVAEGYDESQADEWLPRKYREAQQHYFGELKKQVEAVAAKLADEEGATGGGPESGGGSESGGEAPAAASGSEEPVAESP